MPSIAPAPPSPILNAKKRRRDDHSSASAYSDGSAMTFEMQIEMKLAASPHMARNETTTLFNADKVRENVNARKHILPRSRRDVPKRLRPSGSFDAWNALDDMENCIEYKAKGGERTAPVRDLAKIDLSPCHICYRKPSERRELDDYAHCEGCGKRTCYVCIRQCEGPGMELYGYLGAKDVDKRAHGSQEIFSADGTCDAVMFSFHGDEMCVERGRKNGLDAWKGERSIEHKEKVCSRCCVERGSDGDVWCLGCLRAEEGD